MSKLICTAGMNSGDEFTLREGENSLGRGQECSIVLFDKKCSRKHCHIIKKGTYFVIEDLESRNGTHVNGKKIASRVTLNMGDHIRVGRTTMVISDKPLGNLVEQTATEVAEELQQKDFGKLISGASKNIQQHIHLHGAAAPEKKGVFARLFGGK
jgi:pSer/pThr/pTyr-binding forkhead associated (FHA) protein